MSQAAENESRARQAGKYFAQIAMSLRPILLQASSAKPPPTSGAVTSALYGPAYGVALAAILLCGYRVWVGIAVAAFLIAFLSPVPLVAAMGQAAGATLAALIGAFLHRRFAKFRP